MGHAGALIQGGQGTAASKVAALHAAGAHVFRTMGAMLTAITEEAGTWPAPKPTLETIA